MENKTKVYKLLGIKCPLCNKDELIFNELEYDVEYFGKLILLTEFCKSCGFKHSDVYFVSEKEPCLIKARIECEEDLSMKVIRSSKATITIPEFGVNIYPGPSSNGFISNVEGVLERIEEIVNFLRASSKDKNKEILCNELIEKIKKAKEGKIKFTIIIKDSSGNSAIISKNPSKVERIILPLSNDNKRVR
ncbi:MAG: ZPR1 zinc finger domain-containing protein [Candidatus Bathyarchaeia archaeon]